MTSLISDLIPFFFFYAACNLANSITRLALVEGLATQVLKQIRGAAKE
jgi:hypothetical protein